MPKYLTSLQAPPSPTPAPYDPRDATTRAQALAHIPLTNGAKAMASILKTIPGLFATVQTARMDDMAGIHDLIEVDPLDPRKPPATPAKSTATPDGAGREFWKNLFQSPETLQDNHPHRILVAWRLLREMARRRLEVFPAQNLADGIAEHAHKKNPDPWLYPSPVKNPATSVMGRRFAHIFYQARRLPPEEVVHDPDGTAYPGVPYLPPEISPRHKVPQCVAQSMIQEHAADDPPYAPDPADAPATALEALSQIAPVSTTAAMVISPDYDPADDRQLCLYCDALQAIAEDLCVTDGSEADPSYGVKGLYGLIDPKMVRLVFPTKNEICIFEMLLAERCCNLLIRGSLMEAKHALKRDFGLTSVEIEQVLAMGRRFAKLSIDKNEDSKRALITLRLEEYISRARTSLDLNNEIKGLKLLSIVEQVAKTQDIIQHTTDIDVKVLANKVTNFDFKSLNKALNRSEPADGDGDRPALMAPEGTSSKASE